jgi:hypothetical protein
VPHPMASQFVAETEVLERCHASEHHGPRVQTRDRQRELCAGAPSLVDCGDQRAPPPG